MPERTVRQVDADLARALRVRRSATEAIKTYSRSVVDSTRDIDRLLAERCRLMGLPDH